MLGAMVGSRKLIGRASIGALAAVIILVLAGHAAGATPCSPIDPYLPTFCVVVPTSGPGQTMLPLTTIATPRADLRVAKAIPAASVSGIEQATRRGVADVELRFGRRFVTRPVILVFPDETTFSQGLHDIFGYTRSQADDVAARFGGMFDGRSNIIAIDWTPAGVEQAATAIEHELTHSMTRQIVGASGRLPAWFEEGLAMVVERDRGSADERFAGRAFAATRAVRLADVETLADFQALYTDYGYSLYSYSAEAVQAMTERIGWDGILDVIDAVAAGEPFALAYSRVSGETIADLDARLGTWATELTVRPEGTNVVWSLRTGTPGAPVTVTITGTGGYQLTFVVTVDRLGMYRAVFGGTAAPGSYTLRAAGLETTFGIIASDRSGDR